MPRFYPMPVAQRVRYPNGGCSSPFIVPMSKRDLARFATRILEDQWPETLLPGVVKDGKVDAARLLEYRSADDFDSGSSRLSCAHDGRFWQTVNTLRRWIHGWNVQIGPLFVSPRPGMVPVPGDDPQRRLSDGELAILFGGDDEYGMMALTGLGITDPCKALARTVLSWLPTLEEWEETQGT